MKYEIWSKVVVTGWYIERSTIEIFTVRAHVDPCYLVEETDKVFTEHELMSMDEFKTRFVNHNELDEQPKLDWAELFFSTIWIIASCYLVYLLVTAIQFTQIYNTIFVESQVERHLNRVEHERDLEYRHLRDRVRQLEETEQDTGVWQEEYMRSNWDNFNQ